MEGIYAKLKTSKGSILIELTYQQTPGTVGNFVSLAEGTQENNHKKEGEPFGFSLLIAFMVCSFNFDLPYLQPREIHP